MTKICRITTLVLAVILSGCVEYIKPSSIEAGSVVSAPPASNFFPWDRRVGPWRLIEVKIEKETVRTIYDGHLPAIVRFTDCHERFLGSSDVFLGSHSLYQSQMSISEFNEIYDKLSNIVSIASYIAEEYYRSHSEICGAFSGRNLTLQRVEGGFVVKRSQ